MQVKHALFDYTVVMTNENESSVSFSKLGLAPELIQAVNELGFAYCTPIQANTLPLALKNKDIAGQAQTGTGKTAAFLLASLDYLLKNPSEVDQNQPRVVIISPTRELAMQIHKDALALSKFTDFRLALIYGGVDYEKQRQSLGEGVDILIATPGRLIDYYKQRVFNFKKTDVVVLDEADRMFDLGFIKDIRYLLRRMPPAEKRLNLLFSATLSYRVMELAYEHMNDPQLVKVNMEQVTADKVTQTLYHVSNDEKIPLLLGLMKLADPSRSIVFVNTKRTADYVWGYLEGNGLPSAILSGDVPQKKRQSLFKRFAAGELKVLVATDLAARGLHIPEVSHVFNYDLPQNEEDYVHRIGRTARAGASGDAVSFACEEYVYSLMEIESYIGHAIPVIKIEDSLLVKPEPRVKREHRQIKKKFSGKKTSSRRRRPRRKPNTSQSKE